MIVTNELKYGIHVCVNKLYSWAKFQLSGLPNLKTLRKMFESWKSPQFFLQFLTFYLETWRIENYWILKNQEKCIGTNDPFIKFWTWSTLALSTPYYFKYCFKSISKSNLITKLKIFTFLLKYLSPKEMWLLKWMLFREI